LKGAHVGIFVKKQPTKVQYPWDKRPPEIDAEKEYDLYCRYNQDTCIVYKSIRFKGLRSLPGGDLFGSIGNYHLIEKKDGTQLYIGPMQIILFCEHGVDPGLEIRTMDEGKATS
jgi:hypothetical protein